jgi:hypothetical protein
MKKIANSKAAEINRLHQSFCEGLRTTLQIAIQIGELLIAQKRKCGHGNWIPWIDENLEFTVNTAQEYMRCFYNRQLLNNGSNHYLTITQLAHGVSKPAKEEIEEEEDDEPVATVKLAKREWTPKEAAKDKACLKIITAPSTFPEDAPIPQSRNNNEAKLRDTINWLRGAGRKDCLF